jgi:threonine synthase
MVRKASLQSENGGTAISVTDAEILAMQRDLAAKKGLAWNRRRPHQ